MNLTRLLIGALSLDIALLAIIAWPDQRYSSVPAIRELHTVMQRYDPTPPVIRHTSSVESLPSANVSQGFAAEPSMLNDATVAASQFIGPANTKRLPVNPFAERSAAIAMDTQQQEMALHPGSSGSWSPLATISNPHGPVRPPNQIRSSARNAENANPNKSRNPSAAANKSARPVEPTESLSTEKPADRRISQQSTAVEGFREPNVKAAHSRGWPRGQFTPEEQLYRAQYGWQAFDAALRESALAEVAP